MNASAAGTNARTAAIKAHQRRSRFLHWLRKTHGWIGLWGASLGLLFGTTGVLLNHRAVMRIPAAQAQESNIQLAIPQPAPDDPKRWAEWLQRELGIESPAPKVREEPSRPASWGDKTVIQPARWQVSFGSPRVNIQAEYWVGNDFVSIKRSDNNIWATLNNLHKGSGMGVGWILLVDTLAGSIILLSLTGVLMWTQMNRRRMVGASIAIVSLVLTIGLALQAM